MLRVKCVGEGKGEERKWGCMCVVGARYVRGKGTVEGGISSECPWLVVISHPVPAPSHPCP